MTVKEYMIPVYGLLVKISKRDIETLPEVYQIPVAEFLVAQVERE
ncbi:CD1375 family protein [Tissierella pigra]|nr:CD1375 family protein [Tissierella pigra]